MKNERKKTPSFSFKNRTFQSGGLTLLLCAAAVLAAVLLNLAVRAAPAQYTKFDLSEEKIYSLSEKTGKLLDGLSQDLVLYQIARPGSENLMVSTLLEKYAGRSGYIKTAVIDPVSNPAFIKAYTDDIVDENSVVIVCGNKNKVIDFSDMLRADYDMATGRQTMLFDGEALITSAVSLLTGAQRPVLYVLTGHGEYAPDSRFTDLIEKENYQMEELNLLSTGGVPADAAVVLASESGADISAQEKTYLQNYLDGGGSLLLLTDYLKDGYFYWEELAGGYGLALMPGVAVEQDASHYLSGYPTFILPQLGEHAITEGLLSSNQLYLIAAAQALTSPATMPTGVSASRLLITSENAYLATEEETSETGVFCLAAAAEKTGETPSRFVWITSTSILNDYFDSCVSGANSDFVLNTLNWLAGMDESSTIRPKNLFAAGVLLTASQINFWSTFLVIIIPLLILGAGITVTLLRRRK